jgi:hypothetical protein
MKTKITQVKLADIVPFRGRTHGTTPAKVELNKNRLSEEGFRGYLIGRCLPSGKVEAFIGHNRIEAAKQLEWKTLPFALGSYTDQEAWTLYTRDNSAADGQSTGWAMGVAKNAYTFWEHQGIPVSDIDQKLSGQMGFKISEITLLRDLAEAVDQGTIVKEIENLTFPLHALTIFRAVQKEPQLVTPERQRELINRLQENPSDAVQIVRRVMLQWRKEANVPVPPPPPRLARARKATSIEERITNLSIRISSLIEEINNAPDTSINEDVVNNLFTQFDYMKQLFVPGEVSDDEDSPKS